MRDAGVAADFMRMNERYKRYMAAHGQTAEANPSGGNQLRGLYNIALKVARGANND